MSWRKRAQEKAEQQTENDLDYLGLKHLAGGQSITLTFDGDGEQVESDDYGEGVRFPVTVEESDNADGMASNYGVEEGQQAALVNWGTQLPAKLAELLPDDPEGTTVTVTSEGGEYTDYTVEEA